MQRIKNNISFVALIVTLIFLLSFSVSAANTPTLNQTINSGTLATDILDNNRSPVALQSVAFSAKTFSFDCQYGVNASTGVLGTNTQRLYVINPDAADGGWTLSLAATSGAAALWQNTGSTQNYDFNDPTGTNPGCSDGAGADVDNRPGQLTVNPSASSIVTDCQNCTDSNVTKGSSTGFDQIGAVDSVTLLNAAAGSDDIWRGYLTDVGLSQTIPAEQPADSYSLQMTLTVGAN